MNRNRFSNHYAADLARAAIALNGNGPRLQPALAAIGGYATNPLSRLLPRLLSFHVSGVATLCAKAEAGLTLILALKPRLDFKTGRTFGAVVHLALHYVYGPRLFAGEGVGWTQSRAPLVADLVVARHLAVSHVPLAAAYLTTKPRTPGPVWPDLERSAAYLTGLINHVRILPRNNRHRRAEPPRKPEQLGLEAA